MWSSRRWRASRRASPFLFLSHPSTCAWVRRLNSRTITYILACNTVSFGLDDVLFTAASDSEDFGPALTDSLPPSGQEVRPFAAYSELVDVLLHATEKLSIDWPDRPSASAPPSCPWPSGRGERPQKPQEAGPERSNVSACLQHPLFTPVCHTHLLGFGVQKEFISISLFQCGSRETHQAFSAYHPFLLRQRPTW